MTTPYPKLPDLPSALLQLALDDLDKVRNLPGYKVDMNMWYNYTTDDTCHVCLAGSVLAHTLNIGRTETTGPSDFETEIGLKLRAIDRFRIGDISEAVERLGYTLPFGCPTGIRVPSYHAVPYTEWQEYMNKIVRILKTYNL